MTQAISNTAAQVVDASGYSGRHVGDGKISPGGPQFWNLSKIQIVPISEGVAVSDWSTNGHWKLQTHASSI